jgi:hypothetical protein
MEVSLNPVGAWARAVTLAGRARSKVAARTMRFIDIRRIGLSFVFYLQRVTARAEKWI